MESKVCTACKTELSITGFSVSKGRTFSKCKVCRNKQSKSKRDAQQIPSICELRSVFSYNPNTGTISKNGSAFGYTTPLGYKALSINERKFQQHVICWAIYFGEYPNSSIDHINGNRSDNRIVNMRLATAKQNAQNRHGAQSNNLIGLIGVSKHQGKWRPRVAVDGKTHHFGLFDTAEEAHLAYLSKKRGLHKYCTI
jgi:hypothetical protein